jgi:hypothetical protein
VARRVKGGTVVPFSTAFVCERCHHDRFIGSVTVTKSPWGRSSHYSGFVAEDTALSNLPKVVHAGAVLIRVWLQSICP